MAKKIENTANQGNQYMKNLLGDREIVPLGASAESMTAEQSTPAAAETLHPVTAAAVQPQPAPIPQTSQQPYYPQPGMPYYNPPYTPRKETKMRASFTILPSDFKKLKRIAYMNRITISSIIDDYIKRYISMHTDELDQFEKLSESEKIRADVD